VRNVMYVDKYNCFVSPRVAASSKADRQTGR
jgi:hypothetical protein